MPDLEPIAEVDHEALFNEANADEPARPPEPAAEPEPVAQPRDEAGKFAPKEQESPEPPPAAEKPAVDDNAPQVPSWRVREINEEKRALADKLAAAETERQQWQREQQELRTRLAALEKPAAPQQEEEEPDPLLDPKGYREFIRKQVNADLLNERREMSLQAAHRAYKGEFEEAYSAAQKQVDPALKAMMQQSRDPGETLMAWHRQQKTMREVGNDPNAWLQKKLDEQLNNPEFLAKALERARAVAAPQDDGKPKISLPPTLSGATRAVASHGSDPGDDLSSEGLWEHVNR